MREDTRPPWEGRKGTPNEHRTVGPHRAWCHEDSEWCYPDTDGNSSMLCLCCQHTVVGDISLIELHELNVELNDTTGALQRQLHEERTARQEENTKFVRERLHLNAQIQTLHKGIYRYLQCLPDKTTVNQVCGMLREVNPHLDWSWLPDDN